MNKIIFTWLMLFSINSQAGAIPINWLLVEPLGITFAQFDLPGGGINLANFIWIYGYK